MKKNKLKRGFTLPEVLISLAVITLVIVASTNLVVTIIRTNADNINSMTAYGLAQEGLEAVRNMRDSDWLLQAKFDGTLKGMPVWGSQLYMVTASAVVSQKFIVDHNYMASAFSQNSKDASNISGVAPWKIKKITSNEVESKTVIYKKIKPDQDGFVYGHTKDQNMTETKFHRYIEIKPLRTDDGKIKMLVDAVVFWNESGVSKELKLSTELTDWNQGNI